MLQARRTSHRNLRDAVHRTPERFSMARTGFETGRAAPGYEAPNRSVVDHLDDFTGAFAIAVIEHPKKRRARGSSVAFYKRNHWRTERCSNESPQRHGKCFAIPGTARCEKNRRDSRIATVFPHVRIDRHTLVSTRRRCSHRHVSESIGRGQMRGANRSIQADVLAADAHFSASLFA